MNRSFILIRNVLYNFIGQVWLLALAFLTTPYIVHKLGDDAYGVLTIVTTVIGYFGFLNAGFSSAIVKYVSEYYAQRKFDLIGQTIGTMFIVFGIMGLIGSILIASLTGILVESVLHIPENLISVARFSFYVSAIGFLVNMPLNIFGAIPRALQRFDIVNKINIFFGSLQIGLTVLLLFLGYSLNEIVVTNVIISLVSIFVYLMISNKLLGGISLRPSFNLNLFTRFCKFGGWVSFRQLTQALAVHLDKFVISIFLPISVLTYYAIPHTLTQRLGLVSSNIVPIILPAMSELDSIGEKDKIKDLFIRTVRFTVVGLLPLCIITAIYARELLSYWLGSAFAEKATFALQILSISFLFQNLSWISAVSAQGIDRPDMPAIIYFLQVLVHLALCVILVPKLGINGAALSFGITNIIGMLLLVYLVIKKIGIRVYELIRLVFFKSLVLGILLIFAILLLKPFTNILLFFVLIVITGYIAYLISAYFLIIDGNDRKSLIDYFSLKMKSIRRLQLGNL